MSGPSRLKLDLVIAKSAVDAMSKLPTSDNSFALFHCQPEFLYGDQIPGQCSDGETISLLYEHHRLIEDHKGL